MKLIRPDPSYRESFIRGLQELTSDAERDAWVYLGDLNKLNYPQEDFHGYVREILKRQFEPAPHFVPDITYWAWKNREIVGRISLRLRLNEFLEKLGGHIGYIVRPSHRGKGLASEMLRQILLTPEARQIGRLLVTCDENNSASEKTICRNGGVLENIAEVGPDRPRKKRFWITLPSHPA